MFNFQCKVIILNFLTLAHDRKTLLLIPLHSCVPTDLDPRQRFVYCHLCCHMINRWILLFFFSTVEFACVYKEKGWAPPPHSFHSTRTIYIFLHNHNKIILILIPSKKKIILIFFFFIKHSINFKSCCSWENLNQILLNLVS